MKKDTIWIAIIDSHNAKIFEVSNETPILVKEIILETAPNPVQGRSFDRFGMGRHAIEPHTDFKDNERQHFAHDIAEFLQQAHNQNQFDNLILVSPHKMFHNLEEKLTDPVKHKITHKLHKNISEFSATEIKEYLVDMGIKIKQKKSYL